MLDWRGGQALAAVDGEGRICLRGYFSTHVHAYGPDGAFLKTLGREGEGPGEFKGINGMFVGPGDSLFVLDHLALRLSVFGPDREFARSAPMDVQPSGFDPIAPGWDPDHFYLSSNMRTPDLIGLPIHQVSYSGKRVASFGSTTGSYSPREPYDGLRIIADAGRGRIWSARLARYVIRLIEPGDAYRHGGFRSA